MDDQYIIASYINSSNLIISIDIHPNVHIYIYIYIYSIVTFQFSRIFSALLAFQSNKIHNK